MNEASIGKQPESLGRPGEFSAKEIAQDVWSAQKLTFEPLNGKSDRHLPGLEITCDARSERAGVASAKLVESSKDALLRKLDETYADCTVCCRTFARSQEALPRKIERG